MPYERTHRIEQRFNKVVNLIASGPMNTRKLAIALKVSRPTVQRIVAELKRRGYALRSVHDGHGWHYELTEDTTRSNQ
ncbi:hypothetical protein ES707_08456 [subsurface metagenome]